MMERRNTVILDADSISSKEAMTGFMKTELDLPAYFGGNLSALSDCLSERSEETVFSISRSELVNIAESDYAYRTLQVIADMVCENSYLSIQFTD